MTDELSAQIQNSVNSSGSLFSLRGYTPSNYAAGDIYSGESGSGGDILATLKKNPILTIILIFVILSFLNRGSYGR